MACLAHCFNPRTRVGCDQGVENAPTSFATFQSTHPRGVRLCHRAPRENDVKFQSTHPRGVRPAKPPDGAVIVGFQSTHPRGVRLFPSRFKSFFHRFQSTHPRGVRRAADLHGNEIAAVSIHAPAWGATRWTQDSPQAPAVSIHAPAWGATSRDARLVCHAELVSIHAPAWGATIRLRVCSFWLVMFQSTHPRGVRRAAPFRPR